MKEGDKFRLFTQEPPSVLTEIWQYSQSNNLKLVTLNTLGPSLEDVFVKLTGIGPAMAKEETEKTGPSDTQRKTQRRAK